MTEACDPDRVRVALDSPLPPGLDVLDGLAHTSPGFAPVEVPILARISQGLRDLDTAEIGDPFAR